MEPHELDWISMQTREVPGTFLFLARWIYPSDASINVALSQQHTLRSELPALDVRDARDAGFRRAAASAFPRARTRRW